MSFFEDLIQKVKGKKPVKVREHVRRNPDGAGISVVDEYVKLIQDKPEEEDRKNVEDETWDEDQEHDLMEELNEPEEAVEPPIDLEEDYAEQDIPIDNTVSKNEKLALPKIKEEEVLPLIVDWQKQKTEDSMRQLLTFYNGLLLYFANKYKTGSIPYNLTVLEAKRLFILAANSYNPKKGAKFNTHLTNYLKKLYRFVNDNTNIAKIPEQRIRKIEAYNMALAQLEDKLDRVPTDIEVADYLSWPQKEVARLRLETGRKEILEFGTSDSGASYSFGDLGINDTQIDSSIRLVFLDSSPEERYVMESVIKVFNKPQLSIKDISRNLKLPESKIKGMISNIKKRIIENV